MTSPHEPAAQADLAAPESAEEPETSAWAYAITLLRWRYLIVALTLGSGVLAAANSLRAPREYAATASFSLGNFGSSDASLGNLASRFGLASGNPAGNPLFYAGLLQSREVLRDVALSTYRTEGSVAFEGDLVKYFGLGSLARDLALRRAVRKLRLAVSVSTDLKTGIVRFAVRTGSPELSSQVASRFLALLNEFNLGLRRTQARADRQFIEQSLAQAQAALTTAENALAAFYERNRTFRNSPELIAAEARLQRQVTLRQQLYVTLAERKDMIQLEELRNTPVIAVIEEPQGFVEPAARGTIRKTFLALLFGGAVAVGFAFAADYFARQGGAGSKEYHEFLALGRTVLRRARRS